MPNWLDNLTNPLVPKRAIAGLQNALAPGSGEADVQGDLGDIPGALGDLAGTFGEDPMAVLGGLGSGALEGLRSLTTPLDLAGAALPMLGASKGIVGASRAIPEVTPLMRNLPTGSSLGVGGQSSMLPSQMGQGAARAAEMGDWSASLNPEIHNALRGMKMELGAKPPMPRPEVTRPPGMGASGHGIPDYVPVGGEAAFNALRTPNLGPTAINASPMRQTLDQITSEVGPQGLRNLMKQPIPGRQVPQPPR